jgi:adenosylcobyric acid synthase
MLEGVEIDAEDSVGLPSQGGSLPVAIVRFPRISNFTDFKLLDGAAWVDRPVEGQFETVILPGSKNTIADLAWMRRRGLAEWVLRQHRGGARVLGVCGGYQMLGNTVADPDGVEAGGAVAGLGLLPVDTVMLREKTTQVVRAATPGGVEFVAYEIHMGRTERPRGCEPFAHVGGAGEGVRLGAVAGTYLHGALENAAVLRETLGIDVPPPAPKDQHYEALADWFERHADTRLFEELYL